VNYNQILQPTGSEKTNSPIIFGSILIVAIGVGYIIAKGGFQVAAILVALPFLVISLNRLIFKPELGLTVAFIINFIILGITRYIPFTSGPLMDIILIVTYIAIFFHYFDKKLSLKPLNNELVYFSIIWFVYLCAEFFNPEAISKTLWFVAVRGLGFYMMAVIPLVILLYNDPKHLKKFLYIWAIFSILGSIKAYMQMNIGPDPWEQRWLDQGGAVTHILLGNLRAFSFYSDAGQFGAAQGHIALVAAIISIYEERLSMKIFWWITMIAGFYGMAMSGTRGAISIPFAGFALYLVVRKNFKVLLIGALILAPVYAFFKFTTIGNTNYQIYRMRTAFAAEDDASYQVRINNQIIFESYLKTRPFGGGVGHAGDKALRYTPYAFLATVATDSWFVLIWAETGIIGLFLHMFIIFYILGKSIYIVMFEIKSRELFGIEAALLCGYFGVILSSYGNAVLGQFPTGLIVYTSMAYMFMGPALDKKFLFLEASKQKS